MWCSNYIWVIHNFIAYLGATYIRGLTVSDRCSVNKSTEWELSEQEDEMNT